MLSPFSPSSLEIYWPILVEGALVSVALGLIGCFLVVRGMSLLGDALSHSVLPGIVVGFLIGGSLHSPWILIGATAVGLGSAVLVQTVQNHSRIKEDASLGIVFTALFALGVVMINLYAGQADLDPGCVLYGNIESFLIDPDPIWLMAGVLGVVLVGLFLFYRPLLVSTFDPGLAVSLGIPATLVHYALMGVLSLTIVASFEAVGAILAVALLVLPGATARLWTDRMPPMLLFAAGHGIVSTILGFWLSHPGGPLRPEGTSASGAICAAGFGLFLVSWLLAPRHGLLPRARVRSRLVRNTAMDNLLKTIDELSAGAGAPEGSGSSRVRSDTGVGETHGISDVGVTGPPGVAAVGPAPMSVPVPLSVPVARVAADLRVAPRALASTLAAAVRRGWVTRIGVGAARDATPAAAPALVLTDAGRAQSVRLVRAHELWERYLRQEVGLDADHVHDAAEWVEHYLSEDKVGELDALLARSAAGDADPATHAGPAGGPATG